jgi:tetratricopeptide (TPR) repeat protein
MILVDYYCGRKLNREIFYEKWFYFTLSLARGLVGIFLLETGGSIKVVSTLPLLKRVFIASYSYSTYIIKSIVPYEMVPFYPFPENIDWIFYSSMLLVIFIVGLIYYFFLKNNKVLVFGLLFFTSNIMFLLQILRVSDYFLADRYTYIAYLGLFFIYAFGIQWAFVKYKKFDKLIYLGVSLILGMYCYLNFEQNKIWKNSETLWSHVLKYYPDKHATPWYNRGHYYMEEGRLKEASEDFSKAIFLDPYNPDYYLNRGNVYESDKRLNEAFQDYSQAIALEPDNPNFYNNRGGLYLDSNNPAQLKTAIGDFTKAIQFTMQEPSQYLILRAQLFLKLNMFDDALKDLHEAERSDPLNNSIYNYRARIHIKLGQLDEAEADLEKYLSLDPKNSAMWLNLATVSRKQKQYEKSLASINKAIQLNPSKLIYYYGRLKTYYAMGDIEKARKDLQYLKSKGFGGINPDYERQLIQKKEIRDR